MNEKPIKDPQLRISKEAEDLFKHMGKLKEFKEFENKDFFILSMIFGYAKNQKKKLVQEKMRTSGFTRERYLSEQDNAILKAIAISDDNIDVLRDIQKVYAIAEEYANGGVEILKDFIFSDKASFIKKFSNELKSLLPVVAGVTE